MVRAPTPAKVIWQSQSMPPSPVTIVHESRMIAYAKPVAITPTQ